MKAKRPARLALAAHALSLPIVGVLCAGCEMFLAYLHAELGPDESWTVIQHVEVQPYPVPTGTQASLTFDGDCGRHSDSLDLELTASAGHFENLEQRIELEYGDFPAWCTWTAPATPQLVHVYVVATCDHCSERQDLFIEVVQQGPLPSPASSQGDQ